jgi:hypothetical protein
MEKHLFRLVSQGSSNIIITYGLDGKKMKNKALLVLATMIIASLMVGVVLAQPSVDVSPSVVKPGETVVISGHTSADVTLMVEISNSRALVDSFNITTDMSGDYSVEYMVSVDSPVDVYMVLVDSEKTSFMVSKMTQEQLSKSIRLLVLNAKKQAESALIQARKQGQTIPPEIRNKYTQAISAITQAGAHIESHNYAEAQESLQEALNRFREIVEYSYAENVTPQVDPEQQRIRVKEMISQLWRQYSEINAVTQRLKQYGLNVDILERQLNTLRSSIDSAQDLLDEGNIAEAQQTVTRLQQLVKQRLAELRLKQAEITKRLAERYQLSLENRVGAYLTTFQKIHAVRPVVSALAIQELESLQARLADSEELLDSGEVASALREMHAAEYRLRNLANTVNGAVTNRLLNRIDELAANLQESTGTDISHIQKEIEDTKDSLTDYLRERRPTSTNNATLTP